ncbi:hypothetical protein [Nannocystis pusilla]|uniref:hypothetical protein n=1 Tax=Nannocystis pusilla TaxID=889268 RepID=UPI003B75DC1C
MLLDVTGNASADLAPAGDDAPKRTSTSSPPATSPATTPRSPPSPINLSAPRTARKILPPATLTADAVSDVMKGAAEGLRTCAGTPRGWVKFVVQVRDRRAVLQTLGLNEPGTCAREAVAALRFPAGAGEFRARCGCISGRRK